MEYAPYHHSENKATTGYIKTMQRLQLQLVKNKLFAFVLSSIQYAKRKLQLMLQLLRFC